MAGPARIVLLGTLDTKGKEIAYVRDRMRRLEAEPVVVDCGILGEPVGCTADVSSAEVAAAAGHDLKDVRMAGSRGAAVELMIEGVREYFLSMFRANRLDAVICLGGAEGAALGAAAMQVLPVGVPKVLVSPSASGNRTFAPFVGESDTLVMHSVVDILGLNPISRSIFDNAAAAVVGMARDGGGPLTELGEFSVGVTMLGQTTPGVMRVVDRLEAAGFEPIVFHANGVGGPAMEALARRGALSGVIDFTLSELANTLKGGIHATGRDRLRGAGERGLPQVVVPGCVDFFNQGARESVSAEYLARKTYFHNPTATLVRLLSEEAAELGKMVGERLNEARGPVEVVIPLGGYSLADSQGGELWDPEADRAFRDSLTETLRDSIPVAFVDAPINDRAFADVVAERYLAIAAQ